MFRGWSLADLHRFNELETDSETPEGEELPEDLTELSDERLEQIEADAVEEFDSLRQGDALTADTLARAGELRAIIAKVRAETDRRTAQAAEDKASFDEMVTEVFGSDEEGDGGGDEDAGDDETGEETEEPEEVAEPEAVAASARKLKLPASARRGRKLNVPMKKMAAETPAVRQPLGADYVITAAADIQGIVPGTQFETLHDVGNAFYRKARIMGVTHGNPSWTPIGTVQNQFDIMLREKQSDRDKMEIIRDLISSGKTSQGMESLVAAGGWCAPSETRYSFYNITCEDGMIDVPTFGVERGGIRWPISLSLADILELAPPGGTAVGPDRVSAADTVPFLWTETSDILAVTGGAEKLCLRAECPTFDERRLECYGVCITAGNLTDAAFPELTADTIAKVMSAHYHIMNTRFISQMVALSTAVTISVTGTEGVQAVIAPLLGAVELQAIDYRLKHGMCDNDVLEVVLPSWGRGPIRSDLAKRNGMAEFDVSDEMIDSWFDRRGVRVQWVKDWQQGSAGLLGQATPATAWPDQIQFMIYAAGTFGKGNGFDLTLGLTRDSVLNSTNDHTAVWTEECHLIAMFGHESRVVTVDICPSGLTGGVILGADCGAYGP